MIMTNSSPTRMINLMQTLGSLVSKACWSEREERTVPRNQLLWTRIAKSIRRLAIALILLSLLAVVDLSYAAGRIIFDDFESYPTGTLPTTLWSQFDAHPLCKVVTSSADGVLGPYAGSKMLRCDSTSSNHGENAWLYTSNYTNELFLRLRVRINNGQQLTRVSPRKIMRYYVWHSPYQVLRDVFEVIGDFDGNTGTSNQAAWTDTGTGGSPNLSTYWGDNAKDTTLSSSSWHTIEYYFNHSESRLKVWHDGILVRDSTRNGDGKGFGATKWSEFYITYNWEDAHNAGNYVYFDNFEVFSDNGTGASGQMSDATINVSGSGSVNPTPPNPPQNLQVQ
jgi:hypothetical protein